MIIVQEVFVAKPGMASKLAKMMKDMRGGDNKSYVMTDMTGQFNRVIINSPYQNIQEFEKEMEAYKNMSPEDRQKMSGYQEMYLIGSREIFQVW